jgi:Raf kinase inhibitor-like YbhB/YbcL family protein
MARSAKILTERFFPHRLIPFFWEIPALLFLITACKNSSPPIVFIEEDKMTLQMTSTVFTSGSMIPKKYSCDAENVSPPLSWTGVPQGTKSLALIVDDPDAPVGIWVHWVLYDMPSDLSGLPEGVKNVGIDGYNDFGKTGYGGPCPPKGSAHRYFFKLYALDSLLNLKPGASKREVEKVMQSHILAQGQLVGKYAR